MNCSLRMAPRLLAAGFSLILAAAAHAAGPPARRTPAPPVPPVPPTYAVPYSVPSPETLRELQRYVDPLSFGKARPRGWFGIALNCEDCSIRMDDSTGAPLWRFRSAPEIVSVDPESPAEQAGVQQGDLLKEIDGVPITSAQGGRRFGAVKPNGKVRWTLDRYGKTQSVTLTAEEHPDNDFWWADDEMRERLQSTIDHLEKEEEALRAQKSSVPLSSKDQAELQELENSQRELKRLLRQMDRNDFPSRSSRGWWWAQPTPSPRQAPRAMVAPVPPVPPDAPLPPSSRSRHLRYQGKVGGSDVEVRGSGAVAVTEDRADGEVVITTPDATIRIRKSK